MLIPLSFEAEIKVLAIMHTVCTILQVVEGVGKATAAAVKGLQASSEFLSRKIFQGGVTVKNNTDKCTEPKPISETTRTR